MVKTKRKHLSSHNKTIKNNKINGRILLKKDGWITAEIYGEPFERGFANGYLFYKELKKIKYVLHFLVKDQLNVSWKEFINKSNKLLKPIVIKKFQIGRAHV